MTRVLLLILAVLEVVVGLLGLIGAAGLFFSHSAGMTLIFLPVLALFALLLVAGAAIFVRRPWGYYLHIGVILLVGVLFVLYLGSLAGADTLIAALPVGFTVLVLTGIFFLPPVRRYFGV